MNLNSITKQIHTAVKVLKNGGLIAMPTDTLYGLGVSAYDYKAIDRLYSIKNRPSNMPLPILIAENSEIERYTVAVSELTWRLVETFLPGNLTIVLRRGDNLPKSLSGGSETIGLRIPDHCVPREIIRELGNPITGTSANLSGMIGTTDAESVYRQLGGQVDYIVDGGPTFGNMPSTVIDMSKCNPILIREGGITKKELEKICGTEIQCNK